MVNILLAEGCDDIFDDGKAITVLDKMLIRLIQKHDNGNAVNPPYLGGSFVFEALAA